MPGNRHSYRDNNFQKADKVVLKFIDNNNIWLKMAVDRQATHMLICSLKNKRLINPIFSGMLNHLAEMPVLAFPPNAIEIGRLMQKLNRTPLLNNKITVFNFSRFGADQQLVEALIENKLMEKDEEPLGVMP